MPSSLLGSSWQTKAQQDQAGWAVHSWDWGEHNQAEGADGNLGRFAGTAEKPSDPKTCWVFMQDLPAHLQPWTLMWLHVPKKTSLIWQGMQATPSLSQWGILSHASQHVPWIQEKELFTFREVASFPPFIVGRSHPYPQQGNLPWAKVSAERGEEITFPLLSTLGQAAKPPHDFPHLLFFTFLTQTECCPSAPHPQRSLLQKPLTLISEAIQTEGGRAL